jgi:hypothetical protein
LNAAERRAMKAAALQLFVRQLGRKAQKGVEPNDRHYSREVELAASRLRAEALDELLRDGEHDIADEAATASRHGAPAAQKGRRSPP